MFFFTNVVEADEMIEFYRRERELAISVYDHLLASMQKNREILVRADGYDSEEQPLSDEGKDKILRAIFGLAGERPSYPRTRHDAADEERAEEVRASQVAHAEDAAKASPASVPVTDGKKNPRAWTPERLAKFQRTMAAKGKKKVKKNARKVGHP